MIGSICLIKISSQKIVPALCLEEKSDTLLFAQLRKATDEDIFNTQDRDKMARVNKGKPKRDQIRIREKYEINTVFVDRPKGLNSKSVVMVKKLYSVKKNDIIKNIAQVSEEIVIKCKSLIEQVRRIAELQKELQVLKKKVQLAQMNNEKYTHHELRIEKILGEIGYKRQKNKEKRIKTYGNYREVPNKGFIKIYYGGR
ncbi:hypothetical protein [Bacillus cereus]|uniref:hypothetical protein n=1 Tax=Bacillus cereus TaxID=1396 RepID=UPI000BF7C763|nr:hypothetical protein [Bacillus cereus]PFI17420.1 hypothetical protein COI75_19630 [Bacillus cereus]